MAAGPVKVFLIRGPGCCLILAVSIGSIHVRERKQFCEGRTAMDRCHVCMSYADDMLHTNCMGKQQRPTSLHVAAVGAWGC